MKTCSAHPLSLLFSCSHNTHTSTRCLFLWDLKGISWMDSTLITYSSPTNEKHAALPDWNTQQPPRENTMSVELIKSTWGLTDRHTHTQGEPRARLTAAHISSFTVNDSWCVLVRSEIPYECTHLAVCTATTREANERVKMVKKDGRKSILSSSSWFPLISPHHYVYLCFWVCPSLSFAVKLSDGAGLRGIDHDKRLQALSTDGGVYDSATLHRDAAKPCPSIMLSTCCTKEVKCEKNREEGREGKETYLSTCPLLLPLPTSAWASGLSQK